MEVREYNTLHHRDSRNLVDLPKGRNDLVWEDCRHNQVSNPTRHLVLCLAVSLGPSLLALGR